MTAVIFHTSHLTRLETTRQQIVVSEWECIIRTHNCSYVEVKHSSRSDLSVMFIHAHFVIDIYIYIYVYPSFSLFFKFFLSFTLTLSALLTIQWSVLYRLSLSCSPRRPRPSGACREGEISLYICIYVYLYGNLPRGSIYQLVFVFHWRISYDFLLFPFYFLLFLIISYFFLLFPILSYNLL